MESARIRWTVVWMTLFCVAALTRACDASPLDAQVALPQGYATFDEAVAQLESATGLKIACPADVATAMRGVWNKGAFPSQVQDDLVKTRRPAKDLVETVCNDLALTWRFSPTTQTLLLDVPWRASDSRSTADLLQAIWKPAQEGVFSQDEQWWRALDGLLSKEENFVLACRIRQRASLASLFRLPSLDFVRFVRAQMLTEASVTSTSGARYQCLFMVRAMEATGHGNMSYYCFDDRGTLKIADVINTGHRMIVDQLAVNPKESDGSAPSDIRMVFRHNNGGEPRSISFVLKEHGLVLVDESRAGETLLNAVE